MVKIINKETLYERRVKNNFGIRSSMFYGKMKEQEKTTDIVRRNNDELIESIVRSNGGPWQNSAGYARLWSSIEDSMKKVKAFIDRNKRLVNVNQFPDDYYDLIDLIRMDLTRRRIEAADYTAEFTNEITNPNYPQSIPLIEFLPFAGAFEPVVGTGQNVAMIQQKTGVSGSVDVTLYALGHARSLEDELYNLDIYSLEKVLKAVNRAHTGLRNNRCFNPLIALSMATPNGWSAFQRVAADTTGATYDVRLYLTLRNAIRRLMGLLDMQTGQEIDAEKIVLLCRNKVIQWDIARVVDGQLEKFGTPIENRGKLGIDELWLYKGDVVDVGEDRVTYNGVPEGVAYLFVPGPAGAPTWTLNKRQLTQEIGRGNVLQLARERRAWYFGQAEYRGEFMGNSGDLTPPTNTGYGYVVEITLPDPDDET